jgi:hypothetical protein
MRKDKEQSLSEVLRQFIATNKLEKGLTEAEVIRLWPEIMGPVWLITLKMFNSLKEY